MEENKEILEVEEKEEKKTKTKYLEAKLAANRRYYQKNKEKVKESKNYHTGKVFIRRTQSIERLQDYIQMATERIKEIENGILVKEDTE